jgi:hypothetical protein
MTDWYCKTILFSMQLRSICCIFCPIMLVVHFNLKIKHSVKVVSGWYDVTKMVQFDVRVVCKQPCCQAARLFRMDVMVSLLERFYCIRLVKMTKLTVFRSVGLYIQTNKNPLLGYLGHYAVIKYYWLGQNPTTFSTTAQGLGFRFHDPQGIQ